MAWTDPPRTWVTGETPTAAIFNAHLRDQLIAAFPLDSGPFWKDWTPTPGNLAVGNGTERARFARVGESVIVRYNLIFGSTTLITGPVNFTPPQTIITSYNTAEVLGNAAFVDGGTAVFAGQSRFDAVNAIEIEVFDVAATHLRVVGLSSTVPFTWTTNDVLSFNAVYEAV